MKSARAIAVNRAAGAAASTRAGGQAAVSTPADPEEQAEQIADPRS